MAAHRNSASRLVDPLDLGAKLTECVFPNPPGRRIFGDACSATNSGKRVAVKAMQRIEALRGPTSPDVRIPSAGNHSIVHEMEAAAGINQGYAYFYGMKDPMAGSLDDLVAPQGALWSVGLRSRLQWLTHVATALKLLHYHNLAHGNVELSKVLLTTVSADATAKIYDVGLSNCRRNDAEGGGTRILSTAHYMYPSTADNEWGVQKDINDFGVLAAELLHARVPVSPTCHPTTRLQEHELFDLSFDNRRFELPVPLKLLLEACSHTQTLKLPTAALLVSMLTDALNADVPAPLSPVDQVGLLVDWLPPSSGRAKPSLDIMCAKLYDAKEEKVTISVMQVRVPAQRSSEHSFTGVSGALAGFKISGVSALASKALETSNMQEHMEHIRPRESSTVGGAEVCSNVTIPDVVASPDLPLPYMLDAANLQFDLTHAHLPKLLGRGVFGIVYAGTYLHEPVAVKDTAVPGGRHAFHREVSIQYRLRHDNVVVVKGAITQIDDGHTSYYIIMDRMAGSLAKLVRPSKELDGALPPPPLMEADSRVRLRWLLQMATALQYLHAENVIHGDLKPENVLLDAVSLDATAKLSDFGLSAVRDASMATRTTFREHRGTVLYLDPVLLGEIGSLKSSSDIYSFGILSWELLSGSMPFKDLFIGIPSDKHVAVLKSYVCTGGRPPLDVLDVPQPVRDIIARCWSAAQEARPTGIELVSCLRQILDTSP
jgi:serine/threonine protein kinase